MASRDSDQDVPVSLLLNEAYPNERTAKECLSENMSEASSHDSFYDSLSDLHDESIDGTFPELSAFLSQDEISKSLDIAREAFSDSKPEENVLKASHLKPTENSFKQLNISNPMSELSSKKSHMSVSNVLNKQSAVNNMAINGIAAEVRDMISPLLTTSPSIIRTLQAQKASKNAGKCSATKVKNTKVKQTSVYSEAGPQNDMCKKAASFIEELSAIFRETSKARDRRPNGDSSSPDSGYLSPKSDTIAINTSKVGNEIDIKPEVKPVDYSTKNDSEDAFITPKNLQYEKDTHKQNNNSPAPSSAARFIQKLRSQEVAEGSRVRLECRVTGNPTPEVR